MTSSKPRIAMTVDEAKRLSAEDRPASDEFLKTLTHEDALGMVIRAHIQIESVLQEFIRGMAPRPEAIKFGDMDFDEMIRLALILGLEPTLKPSLTAVGGLRNKFAHRLDMALTPAIADGLYETLTAEGKRSVQRLYSVAAKPGGHPPNFKDGPAKGRVALCMVAVRGALRVQLARVTHHFAESH